MKITISIIREQNPTVELEIENTKSIKAGGGGALSGAKVPTGGGT